MREHITLTVKIALAYFISALAGILLAMVQQSTVALFWPPSGIALAAVLLRDRLALPGIFTGALAINLLLMARDPSLPTFSASVVISLSATLAALVAGGLLKRFAPSAPIWSSAADLLRASCIMAVVCLIPAVLGSGSLYAAGQLPRDIVGATAGLWWLGDFCGMAIFTPMAYAIARRMKGDFWRPIRPEVIAAPTALNSFIALLALVSFLALRNAEASAVAASLEREAVVSAQSITRALRQAGRDIDSIQSMISAKGGQLDKVTFTRYARALFSGKKNDPGTYGVSWAPRISKPGDWELRMLKEGSPTSLRLFEWDASGGKVPVGRRDVYYPLQYLYSAYSSENVFIGFDVGSEPVRRENFERARDTGQLSMNGPRVLPGARAGERLGVVICLPVYRYGERTDTLEQRRTNFSGVVCGAYLVDVLIDLALAGYSANVDLHVFGGAGRWSDRPFHSQLSSVGLDTIRQDSGALMEDFMTDYLGTAEVSFAGHNWLVVAKPGPGYVTSFRTWIPVAAFILIVTLGIVGSSVLIERASARRRVAAERRVTEQALQEARAANEAKSYFMAAASHDIKQPLYALGILTDSLLMSDPPESARHVILSLKKSVKEMSQHFDTLMDIGRFQDGSFEVVSTAFPLSELSRRIALEIGPLCREKGLKWTIAFDDVNVVTDAELLLRLIRNLLINAVRYTGQGEVSCTATAAGDTVEFRIADTGPGLSPEQQQLVLGEPVDTGTDQNHLRSLGLGLSIVSRISHALGIHLTVQSSGGQGTVYTFSIPGVSSADGR